MSWAAVASLGFLVSLFGLAIGKKKGWIMASIGLGVMFIAIP